MLLAGVGIPTPPTSDALQPTDLRNPAAYRGALHRELVLRRPGQYPRRWLANRLGVSRWSCRRYETEQSIAVQPMYQQLQVTWTNFESLLPAAADDAPAGLFLETSDGKRYPPLRPIAMRLLSARIEVVCKRQSSNHYSPMVATRRNSDANESATEAVGIPTPTSQQQKPSEFRRLLYTANSGSYDEQSAQDKPVGIPTPQSSTNQSAGQVSSHSHIATSNYKQHFFYCMSCLKTTISDTAPVTCKRCGGGGFEQLAENIWQDVEALKQWWQHEWRRRHPHASHRATPLVGQVRRRNYDANNVHKRQPLADATADPTAIQAHQRVFNLSLQTARKLVRMCGAGLVERGLDVLEKRNNIRNPAGFLISWLKSEYLFCYKDSVSLRLSPASSQANAESWRQEMADSPYVSFLANADEFEA